MSRFDSLMDKVIRVGDGRGFVVEGRDRSLVITASHCLPHLPPRHPAAHMHERMHRNLLGRLGSELTVWTEVLFVDPVADIAVLGEPDGQELYDECEAYFQLLPNEPLHMTNAPETSRAWLLSLEGEWFGCEVWHHPEGPFWIRNAAQPIVGGMSGSPILNDDGAAIGVACTGEGGEGGPNPCLAAHLPGWLAGKLLAPTIITAEKKLAARMSKGMFNG
jgi:hypothetical protein